MSTFGTAVVIDVRDSAATTGALAALPGISSITELGGGWTRVLAYIPDVGQLDLITTLLNSAGLSRAAVAEDNDEYGALWVVLGSHGSGVETVHRRYVLNANPNDPDEVAEAIDDLDDEDPRGADVAGVHAATAAAKLFDVEPAAVVAAEVASESAYQEIGAVGGPFPWWDALNLPWPGDG